MSQLFKTGIVVSKGNSTIIPLAANGVFIGDTDDVTSYEEMDINLAGGPNNAVGSLYFEFSPDGINWDVSIQVSGSDFGLNNNPPQHLGVVLPYFRVKYYNGNVAQTEFRLTTVYHRVSGTRLTRYLNQTIDNTEGVEINRAIIDGYKSDGTYGNIIISDNNHLISDSYITDGISTVGITDVLGQKALKVDVIKTVSGGGTGGTSSNFADPFPTAGTAAGYSDGYYMRDAMVYDLDLSPSSEFVIGTNLRTFGPSGSVETGTLINPLRIDVTGTTTQPISGNIGITGAVIVDQGTNPWLVQDILADGYFQNIISNQTNGTQHTIVDGYIQTNPNVIVSNFPTTQLISGTVIANQGTSPWVDDITDRSNRLLGVIYGSQGQQIKQTATNFNTQVELAVGGGLIDPRQIRALTSSDVITANQGTSPWIIGGEGTAGSPIGGVVSIQGVVGGVSLPVTQIRSTTPNETSVAASATNVTLLLSNANRLGATIWNESTTEILYLKLGTTASLTSYTAQLFPSGYYEVPYNYTGQIDGIWTAAIGNARITELT